MSDSTLVMTLSSGFSMGLGFLLDLGLLIVALAIVRKRSPTAAWLMSASAVVYLLMSVASPLTYAGVGRHVGTDEYMTIHAVLTVSFSIVRAAAWVLLLGGIAKLASDRKGTT